MARDIGAVLQILFFILIVKPVLLIILGMRVKGLENLPKKGPAILIANHNSHLDTLVLMNLFKLRRLRRVRPVAAADYFLKGKVRAWLSQNVMHIIPIERTASGSDPLVPIYEALERDEIVIFYPEGSRGEPEQIQPFKKGIAKLCSKYPDVPTYPIFMKGLGRALPKGDPILVPFFCDVVIDEPTTCASAKCDDFSVFLYERILSLKIME